MLHGHPQLTLGRDPITFPHCCWDWGLLGSVECLDLWEMKIRSVVWAVVSWLKS